MLNNICLLIVLKDLMSTLMNMFFNIYHLTNLKYITKLLVNFFFRYYVVCNIKCHQGWQELLRARRLIGSRPSTLTLDWPRNTFYLLQYNKNIKISILCYGELDYEIILFKRLRRRTISEGRSPAL